LEFSELFPSDKYRSYEDSLKNLSLALVNGHFSQSNPRPNVPAVIEVGGLQVKPKPDPLPEVNFFVKIMKV
jgi:glucuronosyltransferase